MGVLVLPPVLSYLSYPPLSSSAYLKQPPGSHLISFRDDVIYSNSNPAKKFVYSTLTDC